VRPAGRDLRAVVRADRPGSFGVVAVRGRRMYQGRTEVRDPLAAVLLGGDWALRFEREGAETVRRPLGSWTAVEPGFSGSAVYERDVELDAATLTGREWTLDLGDVRDVAEVQLNGQELPPRLWAPYRVDATSALRPGRNTIRVRVTNTGANARGEHRASGLLGPVALRPERLVPVALEPLRHGERALELDADPLALAPGQARTTTVTIRDLAGRSGDVELAVTGDGVVAEPQRVVVRLDEDGVGRADVVVRAPVDAAVPGQGALILRAGEAERRVPVRIDYATRLGRASASSSFGARTPELAIDGITDSGQWDAGQGWNDGTPDAYPDTLTVDFAAPAPIGRIRVHTLGSAQYPPGQFGIADFDVQVRVGDEWRTVSTVRGNSEAVVEAAFPAVDASAVRVVVHAARVSYSRVVELEALPPSG
jgi:F5/8 type C domain